MCACASAAFGCSGSDQSPTANTPADQPAERSLNCQRAPLPSELDPRSVNWELVVPPHGARQRDGLIDTCDSFVSLAHDMGPGGKLVKYGTSQVLVTADGLDWTASEINSVANATFFGLERGAGRWVAVGRSADGGGVIASASSPSSESWHAVFTTPDWPFEHVVFGDGVFVAQARLGVAVSADGERWHTVQPATTLQFFDVAFGNGRFVLAGVDETFSSSDGEHWENVRCQGRCDIILPDGSTQSGVALQQVRFMDGEFYAFGASGALASQDGVIFGRVARNIPDAAIGGLLISLASDAQAHFLTGHNIPDPPRVYLSRDAGATYFKLPLTVRETGVDCALVPCVAVPQGILALSPKPETATATAPLCDGSAGMRLMLTESPGFGSTQATFVAPFGDRFFAIDGQCRYWAQDIPLSGVVTGSLTPEEAMQLSADVAWSKLAQWGNYAPVQQCPDAGGPMLGVVGAGLSCGPALEGSCGCGDEAPVGLPDAVRMARQWRDRLSKAGLPLSGALAGHAERETADTRIPPQAWPLSRSVPSVPNLLQSSPAQPWATARFDQPAETMPLRMLRSQAASTPDAYAAHGFQVRDGAETYRLYLHDELGQQTVDQLKTLIGSWSVE